MAGRGPIREERMDALILIMEILSFPLSDSERAGYSHRGVRNAQHMGSHISCLMDLCAWISQEFNLGMDEKLVCSLVRNHDRHKAVRSDEPRVKGPAGEGPISAVGRLVRRFIDVGFSAHEREEELQTALSLINSAFQPDIIKVNGEIEDAITLYFLRRGKGKREAQFVHDMGQVMDVHVALWYTATGRMEATPYNIRSFADRLNERIQHKIAKLYWERVKAKYLDTLKLVYRRPSIALAQ